jgi:1,4-dihydroxy-2-naphthoate octaprenyltransferase
MKSLLVVLWRSARPPFLLLTPVMIGLAWAMAKQEGHQMPEMSLLFAVLLSSFSAAIASNWLNEHFDAQSGLDQHTTPTPFSGGSKALIETAHYREMVKWAGLFALSVSVWSGLYVVAEIGLPLLLLGIVGASLVLGYTPIINRFPLICLLAPGIGYGLVMYLGSYWAFTQLALGAGVWLLPIPLALVSALLLLNQFPDAEVDQRFGRYHWVIAFGKGSALRVFLGLHFFASLWLSVLLILKVLPSGAVLGLFASLGSLWLWRISQRVDTEALPLQMMAINVAIVLGMPSLILVGTLL